MLSGATLLLAAIASAAAPPVAERGFSELPVCDEAGAFEEPTAEARPAPGPDCSLPVAPPVIECSDPRASLWVQEMIGSCDMPRSASYGAPARPAHDHKSICRGSGCERDALPLRAAARPDDGSSSLLCRDHGLTVPLQSTPVAASGPRRLRSTVPPRLERPPRA